MAKKISIFVHNRNFFGAQIVHIPLLKALRLQYPTHKIVLFSKHQITNVLHSLGYCDQIILEKNKTDTLSKYRELNADITISLRKSSSYLNFMIGLLNRKQKIGFESIIAKLFFSQSFPYDASIYRAKTYLNLLNLQMNQLTINKNNHLTFIPGAGGAHKMWSIENYLSVARQLKSEYNFSIEFVIGEAEAALVTLIADEFSVNYNLDLCSLERLISSSQFVLANDCGPSHFAQIADTKLLVLYSDEFGDAGHTVKEWFNETKDKHYIIGKRNKSINSITTEQVIAKIVQHS